MASCIESVATDDPIDFDSGAPEAVEYIVTRRKGGQVQSPPAVKTGSAEQTDCAISFVLTMRPQSGNTANKVRIGGSLL